MLSKKIGGSAWNQAVATVKRRDVWSAGLLMLSSAALGGIAVALWNRRTLSAMREPLEEGPVQLTQEQQEFFEYE